MVAHADGRIDDATVRDLPDFLRPGDTLVANDTRVIPARLFGRRLPRDGVGEGAKIELLLHRRLDAARFAALARPARRIEPGDRLQLGTSLQAVVSARGDGGNAEIAFDVSGAALDAALVREGEMPLPPYIATKRPTDARDRDDYQTLFARHDGSAAAPTAGLHFTPALLDRLAAKGVLRETVTLHVGAGTFLPVSATDTRDHRMHPEWARLDADTAARLKAVRRAGARIVAVGTTSLRTLESACCATGDIAPFEGDTDIFITPGHRFLAVDVLLTNFHLPRSTLFMLVSAFMGLDVMRRAYAHAIAEGYRFYSYGDACLLFGANR
jgi:S-adenosylmethionine:tRNA ribosyltransferase-isomerase